VLGLARTWLLSVALGLGVGFLGVVIACVIRGRRMR
jgi:hypothetical protein